MNHCWRSPFTPPLDHSVNSAVTSYPTERLSEFARYLRHEQFNVGIFETILMGQAISLLAVPDYRSTLSICRAICCQYEHQWHQFSILFDNFWKPPHYSESDQSNFLPEDSQQPASPTRGLSGMSAGTNDNQMVAQDQGLATGAGRQSTLASADFRFLNDTDAMRRIEHLAEKLAKTIRPRIGRRKKLSNVGTQLAIGATLRKSIKTAGLPLNPKYYKRVPIPARLVVLHDVSHSMTFNNPLLFRFTRGLIQEFPKSEAFVFHMKLFRVTDMLRERSVKKMRTQLESRNKMWFGGTCIADSLSEFRTEYSRRVIKSDTTIIIISDGIDSNESPRLAEELFWLNRKCRRVFWMNPMLERAGFNKNKPSIKLIEDHVSKLLPAHSLDALRRCVKYIR